MLCGHYVLLWPIAGLTITSMGVLSLFGLPDSLVNNVYETLLFVFFSYFSRPFLWGVVLLDDGRFSRINLR